MTDPLGLVATISYDLTTGNLLSAVADAGAGHFNARTSFTHNGVGQVLTATDPLGTVTQYAYDGFGNPVLITRDYGRLNQLTTMGYDGFGDITSVTDPNGHVTTSTWDADRRLTGIVSRLTGSAVGALTTAFAYDPDGRLLQTQQSARSRRAGRACRRAMPMTDKEGARRRRSGARPRCS